MFTRFRSFAHAISRRRRVESDLADELQFHLDARVQDLISQGMAPEEARRRARLEFGATDRVREECREARGLRVIDTIVRNTRFALRLLRRDPVFTTTAVATLALCIGANTAVFSLVDAVLLRPLPYPDPARLAQVVVTYARNGESTVQSALTGAVWEAVRDRAAGLDAAAISESTPEVNLFADGHALSVRQQRVGSGFFRVLGVPPFMGREFTADEDRQGGPPVAVLSHAVWLSQVGGDRTIVGRTIHLRGEPYTVVGVMPPDFRTGWLADVWTPLRPTTTGEGGGSNYSVIARLRPGITEPEADAQLQRIGTDVIRGVDGPNAASGRLQQISLQRGMTEEVRQPLLLLWGAVALVLIIGCANIAGLQLARSSVRAREIGTRVAIGAGRGAVVGQLLTESVVLAVLGAAAGIVVGWLVMAALMPALVTTFGLWQPAGLSVRLLGVSIVVAGATGVAFGLWPALTATRTDLRSAFAEAGHRGVAGRAHPWPRRLLIVIQMALGITLLVGAGLFVRTFLSLNTQPAGFDPTGVFTAHISLQDARYKTTEQVVRLFDESLFRIQSLPGVVAAGVMLTPPYERALNLGFMPTDGRTGNFTTNACYVTPGALRALRVSTLRGRSITEADRAATEHVVVVNEAFVRRYYPQRDILGESMRLGGTARNVVGVVGDVPVKSGWGNYGPLAAVPTVYLPAAQMPDASISMIHTWFPPTWVVRTVGDGAPLLLGIQKAVGAADPLLPVTGFRSIDDVRADSLALQRLRAELFGGLALLALVLTFTGLAGLIAHGVAQRSHEIGIRLALGARASRIVGRTVGQGMLLAAVGALAGVGLALAGARLVERLIWGVRPGDPLTYVVAVVGLLCVAAVASLVPALAIARVDPARTLRSE